MDLVIMPTGEVRCVYDEAIDLHQLGALDIRRASHVEPTATATGRLTCRRSAVPCWGRLQAAVWR